MDLGPDPSKYIEYPGGNGFYFDPSIEETLDGKCTGYSQEDLEQVFRPFLKPHIQTIIDRARHEHRRPGTSPALPGPPPPQPREEAHIFDARRLYFLRFGRMDEGELGMGRPLKFLDVFQCKSRDEIENMLDFMETGLHRNELATYAYAALGVNGFFPKHVRHCPAALKIEQMDEYFIRELCRLNGDGVFFRGAARTENGGGLHPYLIKYAWFYFDNAFLVESARPDSFADGRGRGSPAPKPAFTIEQALGIFGISAGQYSRMTRQDLTRRYRRRAKEMHPDAGGGHNDFVRLLEAYEVLLSNKD